jgi:5S rRNA maturation endonuclease (ribonuclease M5)
MKASSNQILEELEKIKDCIVIVEGIKDIKALNEFGVRNVIGINRRALYRVVEEVSRVVEKSKRRVVILTDLDKTGKKLYGTLNSKLQDFGCRIDNKFREFLFKETQLRQIEGLVRYLEKLS